MLANVFISMYIELKIRLDHRLRSLFNMPVFESVPSLNVIQYILQGNTFKSSTLLLQCRGHRWRRRIGVVFLGSRSETCSIGRDEVAFPEAAKGLITHDMVIAVEIRKEVQHQVFAFLVRCASEPKLI